MFKTLYAVFLALPRIIFTPWREFQVVIPEKGKPFLQRYIESRIKDDIKNFVDEINELTRLRAHLNVLEEIKSLKLQSKKAELAKLEKLTLIELEKAESAALKEFEKNPHSFDEIARDIVEIREMKQKIIPIPKQVSKDKKDVVVKQDNGTTKGGAKNE